MSDSEEPYRSHYASSYTVDQLQRALKAIIDGADVADAARANGIRPGTLSVYIYTGYCPKCYRSLAPLIVACQRAILARPRKVPAKPPPTEAKPKRTKKPRT